MRVRKLRFGLGVAALFTISAPAAAQSPTGEGFALDIYDPTPAGDDLFTVPSATVPKKLTYSGKLVGSLSYRPTLEGRDENNRPVEIVSSAFFLHLSSSLAIASRYLVNVNLPIAVAQSSEVTGPDEPGPAVGDLRISARATVLGTPNDPFSLAFMQSLWVPTGSESNFTGDGRVRSNSEVVLGGRVGPFFYGVDLGFLGRKTISTTVDIGRGLTFGTGAGVVLLEDSLQIALEMNGTAIFPSSSSPRSAFDSLTTPVSGLLGVKYRVTDFVFGVATGPGMSDSPGVSPHVVFSVGYAPKDSATGEPEPPVEEPRDEPTVEPVPEETAPATPPPAQPVAPAPKPVEPTPPPAPAPAPPVETEEEKTARARALFTEGVNHFDAGRFDEARKAFASAYALRPHPTVLLNLAQSELDSGHKADACKHFKQWKASEKNPPKDKLDAVNAGIKKACE